MRCSNLIKRLRRSQFAYTSHIVIQLILVRTRGIYLLVRPFEISQPEEAGVLFLFVLSQTIVLCEILK